MTPSTPEQPMPDLPTPALPGGTWRIGDTDLTRFGYGAMQLAGPWVAGPPADPDAARAVLREVVRLGITHVDTSDAYGPRVTNELIREALHPYPPSLFLATKVGADRDADGGWPPARRPDDVRRQVEDNLERLGVDVLDLVNLRMGDATGPQPEALTVPLRVLADLRDQGVIRHVGVSNVTAEQVAEARDVTRIETVQNLYNLAHRTDDGLIDELADDGIAFVPYFPLGGFTPVQSDALSSVADRLGATPMAVALAWLLQRSPSILLIAGTSSVQHLRQNVEGAGLVLGEDDVRALDGIAAA